MQKKILAGNLKLGMYVILPGSWLEHPFLKGQFLLTSQEQIEKIVESGITEVAIDTAKGKDDVEPVDAGGKDATDVPLRRKYEKPPKPSQEKNEGVSVDAVSHGDLGLPPPGKWEPERCVSDELRNAIHDKTLPPQKKSEAVYKFSLDIMRKLLDSPTAENIKTGKEHLYEVVDVVLSDNDTSRCLLNITSHDFYTYTHSVNVGLLSIMLSKALIKDYNEYKMRELGAGFFLHDLGKVHVDPAIINKPGRLTTEEMGQMRTHPYQGYQLLKEANQLTEYCKIIVMQHHEREDGTGYPRQLKGDEIHLYGRICCIADVFDALTAVRSYKPKLTPFEALKVMQEQMLGHFHKEMFRKFVLLFQ